ncbi:MAG: mannose-1-phosphate guanylyltransferase [Chlorobiota bacterium]|jgi:mannose-1-phosphate guanylyltransferase|nr:mannose-1-phosphate guanylyltransferase [Chlorobiota bacterium]QQS66160.1 MAG: mannose-1-phosphate guanylyltransferase [Chlorobiota bacterium]
MNIYAVIMAGGVGARLWPRSREKSPKQLLHILGEGTMLQNTISRLQPFIPYDKILIVTNKLQIEQVHEQNPQIPYENIISEPFGRNTAPCVALAAFVLQARDPNAVMITLPADHHIQNVGEFQRLLSMTSIAADELNCLATIGISPTRPETGYGYIQRNDQTDKYNPFFNDGLRRVLTFAEKPDFNTAERFIASGDFLWNSGMFIWKVDTILDAFKEHLPLIFDELTYVKDKIGTNKFESALVNAYSNIHPISIDYGIMEKAHNVFVAQGDFGWSDVGSWDEAYRLARKDSDGNFIEGDVIAVNVKNSFIRSDNQMIAVVGLEDVIVIDTSDAILICKKGSSQNVQAVVDYLRRKKINSLL